MILTLAPQTIFTSYTSVTDTSLGLSGSERFVARMDRLCYHTQVVWSIKF